MVEADLQWRYGIDYLDRWRGKLSLRKIGVLIRHLPRDSATAEKLADQPYWSRTDHLLDDIRITLSSTSEHHAKPHPERPLGRPKRLDKARLAAGQKRRAERQRAIAAGEIT